MELRGGWNVVVDVLLAPLIALLSAGGRGGGRRGAALDGRREKA